MVKMHEKHEDHLKLVHMVVHKYYRMGVEHPLYEEYFAVGCEGLCKSINNFDPSRGNKFSTYGVPMILGEIKRHVRDHSNPVKFSRAKTDIFYRYLSLKQKGHTIEEAAKILGVEAKEIEECVNVIQFPASFTDPLGSDENSACLGDKLACKDLGVENEVLGEVSKLEIMSLFQKYLTKRELEVVHLLVQERFVQTEMGSELGVSQAQVSRILKILRKFKIPAILKYHQGEITKEEMLAVTRRIIGTFKEEVKTMANHKVMGEYGMQCVGAIMKFAKEHEDTMVEVNRIITSANIPGSNGAKSNNYYYAGVARKNLKMEGYEIVFSGTKWCARKAKITMATLKPAQKAKLTEEEYKAEDKRASDILGKLLTPKNPDVEDKGILSPSNEEINDLLKKSANETLTESYKKIEELLNKEDIKDLEMLTKAAPIIQVKYPELEPPKPLELKDIPLLPKRNTVDLEDVVIDDEDSIQAIASFIRSFKLLHKNVTIDISLRGENNAKTISAS